MNFDKLTHNDIGQDVAPRTQEEWGDWVSARRLRGYLLGNTLADWLDCYGRDREFVRDDWVPDYDDRLDFFGFVTKQGVRFEGVVAGYLNDRAEVLRIGESGLEGQDLDKARETLSALADGCEVVHHGILWNPEDQTYGVPDFLIRSDIFDRLFPEHLGPGEVEQPAPGLDRPWHYVVLDAKFTRLKLGRGLKSVLAKGSSPAYKGQLFVYNAALGRLQGYVPPCGFLLGRGYDHESRKQEFPPRSDVATERLGPVPMDDALRQKATDAAEWIRRLRREGEGWSPLPQPSVPELNPPRDSATRWSDAIEQIARRRREADEGHTSIAVVSPPRVMVAEDEWREPAPLEFFVDFEFVSDLNDDFRSFPKSGGQAMIFMIGCGHIEDGQWRFRCLVAERLDSSSEARIVGAWLAHMDALSRRFGSDDPRIFHWADAERTQYDSARRRHPDLVWPDLNWFDLLKRVFRAQPVAVRGAHGLGLKSVAKALHAHHLIETSWGDSKVDGRGAMVGAWWCDAEARRKGIRLENTELMEEIRQYNEVDCQVMKEILSYLRGRH